MKKENITECNINTKKRLSPVQLFATLLMESKCIKANSTNDFITWYSQSLKAEKLEMHLIFNSYNQYNSIHSSFEEYYNNTFKKIP